MKSKIGICGLIGCGKSYVAKLIADQRGYFYLNSDELFKEKVRKNQAYKENLSDFLANLDTPAFIDNRYNSAGISKLLFSDLQACYGFPILRALNEFNAPYVKAAIMDEMYFHDNVILEMATLPASHSAPANLDATIMVMGDGWSRARCHMRNHIERILARDSRDTQITGNILKYQINVLSKYVNNTDGVFSLNNMDVSEADDELAENYLSDSDILAQFDEIEKSARALKIMELQY